METRFKQVADEVRRMSSESPYVKRIIVDEKPDRFCPYLQFVRYDALNVVDVPNGIEENSVFVTFEINHSTGKVEVFRNGHIWLSEKDKQSERYKYLAMKSMQQILVDNGGKKMRCAKAAVTVDEKRVHFLIGLIRMVGRLGDRISGLKGDLVAVAMDEGGEGVFFIDWIRQEGISLLRLAAHRRIEEGGLSELPDVRERYLIGRHRLQLGKIRRHGFLRKGIIDIRLWERDRRIFIGGIGCLMGHREGCLARRLLFGGTGFRNRRYRRGFRGLIQDIGDLDGKLLPRDVENNFFQLSFIYIFDPWFPPLVFGRNRQYVFCHGDRKDFVGKHVIVRVVILVDIVQDLIP